MAIDTAAKRRRALQATELGLGSGAGYPIPDGSLDNDIDRAQVAQFYNAAWDISRRIIFTAADGNKIYIETPLWGYVIDLLLPLTFSEKGNGALGVFDATSTYDNRKCTATFHIDEYDALQMETFFTIDSRGRGRQITMTLPSGCGFHPFGPDYGDTGDFSVYVQIISAPAFDPENNWWQIGLELVYISGPDPAYTPPSAVDYGSLTIGDVSELRYPQDGFNYVPKYNMISNLQYGKSVSIVDNKYGDSKSTMFKLIAHEGKTAEFISFLLTGAHRAGNTFGPINIIVQENQFMYGVIAGDTAVVSSQLDTRKITLTHVNYDLFNIELSFRKV